MNSLLDQVILGNPIQNYFILAIILLFVSMIKRYLSRGVATLLYREVRRWAPEIGQHEFSHLLLVPLEYFLLLITFMLTIDHLNFPPELNVTVYNGFTVKMVLHTLMELALTISIIWIILRVIDFVSLMISKSADLSHDITDNQFIVFFRDFFKAIVFIFGAIAFIRILFGAVLVNKIIAGLGIGAAALALAAKESIENLICSFIIFFDKPFRVGDAVKVDSFQGNVEKIGLRSTRIRTLEKTFVTVPNKKMVDSVLDNLSLRTHQRAVMRLEIAGDTPADNILQVLNDIRQLLISNERVQEGFVLNLNEFTKDTYVIQLIYLTQVIEGVPYNGLRNEINLAIISIMERRNVKLSSTKVEIHEK
ncbi:mechanosensitive ion channel family protein [Chitinophaga pinensis]|uniref:MscS Mechanosensitive ion channel n=1 Tax=Chitinophaga pinensis (strain ATCC 43595 / DSM 2588 / LMG 13176 / NBRC 15968 / NCIMB 11800 / UQM 2034) TaxID=485918 RepID=A0A979FZB0_CHIPD|nr:mechanosensitive ion channel domain-containing protein [Chitinophaga pinensis]ACU57940.1 MscS Mechanosensitive ion channel [Chitinophaga pinensis DSM 2588]